MTTQTAELDNSLIFEQDPVQIVDALLPLYLNSCLLRSLQEALASELAARMNAMSNASGEPDPPFAACLHLATLVTAFAVHTLHYVSHGTRMRRQGFGPWYC